MVAVHRVRDGALCLHQQLAHAVTDFNWHPRGRWLGIPDHGGAVQLMDVQTGEMRPLGRHKSNAVVAEFSPDGRYSSAADGIAN